MKKNSVLPAIATLIAHIEKHTILLQETINEILSAETDDIPLLGKTMRSAVLLAGLMENYYTCAETIFVRVSQFFENHLTPKRWHRDLLERMNLEIEGIRPKLLSDNVFRDLLELMRFRHFKRYYFGTAYDWDRLEELLKRTKRVHKNLCKDVDEFVKFLNVLAEK